ncbi:hypothetical protein ABT131_21920 [Streptomyces sp900105245]|uniref:hypothetical protein n=1 Tax=Streptomyces sp. 900105245 TaxID=3154379 RepID=UPI003322BBD9
MRSAAWKRGSADALARHVGATPGGVEATMKCRIMACGAAAVVMALGVSVGPVAEVSAAPAQVCADRDGDGVIDTMYTDSDGDGVVDTMAHDSDGDGKIDVVGEDTNGDGVIDKATTADQCAKGGDGASDPQDRPDRPGTQHQDPGTEQQDSGTQQDSGGMHDE